MFRKTATAVCALTLAFGGWVDSANASSQYPVGSANQVNVYVNDVLLKTDQPAILKSGRTLVPLRAIFEAIGAQVEWDSATQTAKGTKGDLTVQLQLGSTKAQVNGHEVLLDVPAEMINYRTLVPVRFISEALGAMVNWDGRTSSVFVAQRTEESLPQAVTYYNAYRPHLLAINDEIRTSDDAISKALHKEISYSQYRSLYEGITSNMKSHLDQIHQLPLPTDPSAKRYAQGLISFAEEESNFISRRGDIIQQGTSGYDVQLNDSLTTQMDEILGDLGTFFNEYKDISGK